MLKLFLIKYLFLLLNIFFNFLCTIRKSKWKEPLARPRHGWDIYIKMYLKEIGCVFVDMIHVAQDSVH